MQGKVGYKNPPKHTQFAPGQSGNAKGKKPGCINKLTPIKEALANKVNELNKKTGRKYWDDILDAWVFMVIKDRNPRALQMMIDRLYGPVVQEVSTSDVNEAIKMLVQEMRNI